jgi:hypothetical protein
MNKNSVPGTIQFDQSELKILAEQQKLRTFVIEKLKRDVYYVDRVQLYVAKLKEEFNIARKDPSIPPYEFDRLEEQLSYWGRILSAGLILEKKTLTPDDVFAEANKNAQLERAEGRLVPLYHIYEGDVEEEDK